MMKPTSSHENAGMPVEAAVARHQASLLRFAARLLGDEEQARDVVQDTFVKFMSQPREAVEGHEAEWLFTVCRHRAFDLLRREGRMSRFADGQVERLPAAEPRPGAALEHNESHTVLLQLIDRLPPNQQEVIRLKFQSGFSYKEISRITELSVSNVGFLIHTAVSRLRREFAAAAQ